MFNRLDTIVARFKELETELSNPDVLNNYNLLKELSKERSDLEPIVNKYQEYKTEVINRNLPIWMTYEPGSTFKIITLSAALEEQTINLFEDSFYDGGSINVDGATIHC